MENIIYAYIVVFLLEMHTLLCLCTLVQHIAEGHVYEGHFIPSPHRQPQINLAIHHWGIRQTKVGPGVTADYAVA